MHIDGIYSQQKATQMLGGETQFPPPGGNLPSKNVWRPHNIK